MLSIEKFCRIHAACRAGREWALLNCSTMQDVWDKAKPEWLVWVATRRGVITLKDEGELMEMAGEMSNSFLHPTEDTKMEYIADWLRKNVTPNFEG